VKRRHRRDPACAPRSRRVRDALARSVTCSLACALVATAPAFAADVALVDPSRDVPVEAEHAPVVERPVARALERPDSPPEVAQAVAQMQAPEWIDRLTGVYALQRMGAAAAPASPALVAALHDENGLVRFEAAEALFRIGAPAVPPLAAQVSSERDEVRLVAVQTLGRIGLAAAPALPDLRAATADPTTDVRDAAIFALSVVQPEGARDWVRKLAFEIGDEPYGIPAVFAVFVAISSLGLLRSALHARRRRRAAGVPGPDAGAPADPHPPGALGGAAHPTRRPAHGSDADDDDAEADDADDAGAEEDGDAADDHLAPDDARHAGRPAKPVARGPATTDAIVPAQGLALAGAGLVALLVGIGVGLLVTFTEPDVEKRHAVYHFAALFVLFGYLFLKVGVKGAWTARRARQRAATTGERWLRDRAWQRDGTGPIKAERVLPNLVALILWVGFLVPFHTVWRLPFAYWGVWIVLAIFDLIALAILVAVLRRAWRRLRAGRAFLRWQGIPVRPGTTFNARFECSRRLAGGPPLTARLRCLRDRAENPVIGDDPAADADEAYVEEKTFPLHDRPEGGSWAQLSFAVPPKAHGTASYASRPVRWVVTVELPTAGPDFRTTFPVPIYR